MKSKSKTMIITREKYNRMQSKIHELQNRHIHDKQWAFWGKRMFDFLSQNADLSVLVLQRAFHGLENQKSNSQEAK